MPPLPYTIAMRIDLFANDQQILAELGERLRRARIRAELTQDALADSCGLAKSAVERAEKGENIRLLTLVKIMRTLNCVGALEGLLPEAEATPLEILRHSEQRKRVKAKTAAKNSGFKWGDEK